MAVGTAFSSSNLQVYFLSQRADINDQVVAELVKFIGGARHTLDCAIYDIKHPQILDALARASKKVTLRIAYDAGKNPKTVTGGGQVDPKFPGMEALLTQAGLMPKSTAIHVTGSHLMHNKFLVRDGQSVWTGSGNFTAGGLELQDNNFLVVRSVELARVYTSAFDGLLSPKHDAQHRRASSTTPTIAGAGQPVKLEPGMTLTPLFSVGSGENEAVDKVVTQALAKAKKVRIMAMLISDQDILQALTAFRGQAHDIRGVLDPHETKMAMTQSKVAKLHPDWFWFAQGDARFVDAYSHAVTKQNAGMDNHDLMHHKVMILDDHLVITGSYNFSESAELNDENVLLIDSKSVAKAYDHYFNLLFAKYTQHWASVAPQ